MPPITISTLGTKVPTYIGANCCAPDVGLQFEAACWCRTLQNTTSVQWLWQRPLNYGTRSRVLLVMLTENLQGTIGREDSSPSIAASSGHFSKQSYPCRLDIWLSVTRCNSWKLLLTQQLNNLARNILCNFPGEASSRATHASSLWKFHRSLRTFYSSCHETSIWTPNLQAVYTHYRPNTNQEPIEQTPP